MYELTYDYMDECGNLERNLHETFTGSYEELRKYIRSMRQNGCFCIDAFCLDQV